MIKAGWLRRVGWLGSVGWALVAMACSAGPVAPAVLAEQHHRSLLGPTRLAWLSSEQTTGPLPGAVALGGKVSGRSLLYFEFARPSETGRLLRAELVLETSGASGASIEVELSRADAAAAELRTWSDQPRARYPRLSARLPSDGAPARLDVTELLRAESKPGEPLCLLLRAEPSATEPLLITTGAAGGAAPRLDSYWE
jgi:hypothetical protein